ncbi:MAG: DNA phosphorothioation system restriction enzyme [Trichodesmium sp. MAG_R04]|nr:DNA phosphorothioation system restriction enzyme [Trichodesmium sp. MAG_R04]
MPSHLKLRSYQQQAVNNWFANRGRGILKMATGTGKTITALAIATQLYQKISLQALIVVCPYRHLVTQWGRECKKFALQPILAFENVHTWQNKLSTTLYNIHSGHLKFISIITTNSTFISDSFQSQLKYFPEKTLIIGDEAHHLGSPKSEKSLPKNIGLRLALSATPERYFDDQGTTAILDYFGQILQPELTLANAIQQGALVRYIYHPILVELTEDESRNYVKLTSKIGWALLLSEKENAEIDQEDLTALLIQRSRLIASAKNKLTTLKKLMANRLQTTHTLFYCGDGFVEKENISDLRQMEAVVKILGSELGYRVNTYTAKNSIKQREKLRKQFESGELQGLVAIHCLDEGIDIPAIKNAVILASSQNPRQFIQRRGRILRPHPSKERATLFDMIVLPPDMGRSSLQVERNLLRKELKRFLEFADLADNAGEARIKLLNIQKKYGLLDI